MNVPAGAEYAGKHGLEALIVTRGDDVVEAVFANGFTRDTAHALYSGTKSFWGPVALYAQADGILTLDERVAETIPSWDEDPRKRRVTLRMLLSLTAGFGFGGLGSAVPMYDRALAMPLKNEPATAFTYGGIPLQVFGAVLARKLAPKTPHDYLRERVLEPAGVRVAKWRTLADGTHPLPTGAFVSAENWLAYGRFVLHRRIELGACFSGSAQNARYGLGWWLNTPGIAVELFYASGSRGQALYVVPSLDLVVVHFGKSASYKHEALLKRLLAQ